MKANKLLIIFGLIFLVCSGLVSAVGEVSYYDCNDDLNDNWGANDGVLINGAYSTAYPTFADGITTGATKSCAMNGASSYINTSINSLPSSFTLSTWGYIDTDGAENVVFSKNSNSGFWLRTSLSSNTWQFYAGNGYVFNGVGNYTKNTWYNWILDFNSSTNIWHFYQDNNLISSGTKSFTTGSANLLLGVKGGAGYFDGLLDEIQIYNKILTSDERQNIYESGTIIEPADTFTIYCKDLDSNIIINCNATIDDTDFFSTTNGTINTDYETGVYDVIVESEEWFTQTFTDYNVSDALTTSMWQSEITASFTEKITEDDLSNWELWHDGDKIGETTGTSVMMKLLVGEYEDLILKSKDASFPDRYLSENISVTALDIESFTDSVYLFDYYFSGVDEDRENEAVTIPFNYTFNIVDNSTTTRYYDIRLYVDNVLTTTKTDKEDGEVVEFVLGESFVGLHNLSFELVDEYGRVSDRVTDEVNFYGTVITINFLTEEGESINISGTSFFSCTGIYDVASTLDAVTYYLDCIPEWYRFTQDGSSMTRKITVTSGVYSTNIYLFDGIADSFVVKPVQIGDMFGEDVYIIRNGNIIHIEEQDDLGRIYPMLRIGYEYDVGIMVGSEIVIIGNFIPLDDSVFILFANSYTLNSFDKTFYKNVLFEIGFTGSNNSIYVRVNNTYGNLSSARVRISYYNNSYIASFDSTINEENEILFLHPLNDAEKTLINETDFKIIIDFVHDQFGTKQVIYYLKNHNKLSFTGISSIILYMLGLITIFVIVALFTKVHEGIGVMIASSFFMLFQTLGVFAFSNLIVYGLGSFFFIMGLFITIKNNGVMT